MKRYQIILNNESYIITTVDGGRIIGTPISALWMLGKEIGVVMAWVHRKQGTITEQEIIDAGD